MLTPVVQRWKDRRGIYRPAGEVVDTRRFEVVQAMAWRPIRGFIVDNHYAGTFAQCSRGFELRGPQGALVGAATLGVVSRTYQPHFGEKKAWLCLTRFVLADEVPANAETWMLARIFELLREDGFVGVVSYSDPVPRPAADGGVVFAGHVGTIYQAHNGVYTGRSKPETKWLLPDGTVFESRAGNKVKAGDQGREYAERTLVRFGAPPLRRREDPRAWVDEWKRRLCRPLKHTGNFRYLWALGRRDRRHLPASLPYPKFDLRTAA
jgi:hypothetical protein